MTSTINRRWSKISFLVCGFQTFCLATFWTTITSLHRVVIIGKNVPCKVINTIESINMYQTYPDLGFWFAWRRSLTTLLRQVLKVFHPRIFNVCNPPICYESTVALKWHHYINFSLNYMNFDFRDKILCDYIYIMFLHVYIIIYACVYNYPACIHNHPTCIHN